MRNQIFGKAIATLRKQYKLGQSDIIGLSERQVRRIEQGDSCIAAGGMVDPMLFYRKIGFKTPCF